MRAAVCYEYNKPLVIEEVEVDAPAKGEAKIRVAATAICHSDIHAWKGELPGKLPGIPGHETAGYVMEVGEGVTHIKTGDAVIVSAASAGCGQCYMCLVGLRHMCLNLGHGWAPHHRNKKGQPLSTMAGPVGGLAEEITVLASRAVKVPSDMPIDRAALLACCVITGFGAAINRAQVRVFNSVVVMGCGGVGLNAIQGSAYSGGHPIIGVDVLDNKLEAARLFGATHTINSAKDKDPIKTVQDITDGRGADFVFLTVGSLDALKQAFQMAGRRGMTIVIGIARGEWPLTPGMFIGSEKILTGSMMGSPRLSLDIPRLVSIYQAKRLKLDELITRRYPLDRVNEAIESYERGEAIRNVIMLQ